MNDFDELTGVVPIDHIGAYNFFHKNIKDFAPVVSTEDEAKHVASVLATYAETSTVETGLWSIPRSPVNDIEILIYSEQIPRQRVYEVAGARVLFLAGFFRRQVSKRHNVKWLDQVGQTFYGLASESALGPNNSAVLRSVSKNFPDWTRACMELSVSLEENQYLLKL